MFKSKYHLSYFGNHHFLFFRSYWTSPPWICTGVTYVGMTMWKSGTDTGGKRRSKVSFDTKMKITGLFHWPDWLSVHICDYLSRFFYFYLCVDLFGLVCFLWLSEGKFHKVKKKKFQFWLFSFKFSWSELVTKLNVKEVTHMTELLLYSSQVVFVAISYLSQSSPQTAGCGLNSAAAVTGWEKASLQFMKVSAHSPPPPFQHVVQLTKLSSSSDCGWRPPH